MKIYVRHGDGELMFPSFREFLSMYKAKFIAPDDLVRREFSDRWIRAGDMPELRSMHLYRRQDLRKFNRLVLLLFLALVALIFVVRLASMARGNAVP